MTKFQKELWKKHYSGESVHKLDSGGGVQKGAVTLQGVGAIDKI